MITLSTEEAGNALGLASLVAEVPGVSIDSRTIRPGELFVALKGERFDGHDYVRDVLTAGAGGVVVEAVWREAQRADIGDHPRVYAVPGTLAALSGLANAVRRKASAVVVAITGSVGKTGTKDLLGMMAAQTGKVVVTAANQNNEIGVPLTLLSLEPDTDVAIVEMGMRGLGQIAALVEIAEPDVSVVTNIHPVHLELLGSLENVAQAKAEILAGVRPGGVGVVPADCPVLDPYLPKNTRLVRFGLAEIAGSADVWGEYQTRPAGRAFLDVHWPGGEATVQAPFCSRPKMENALAAAAACFAADLPVEKCLAGLDGAVFTPSRGDVERIGDWLVINDTYNASPAAVKASLDELVRVAAEEGRRPVAVLGDMLELGPEAARYHEAAGVYAAERGVQLLWGVGPLSRSTVAGFERAVKSGAGNRAAGPRAGHVDSSAEAAPVLAALRPEDAILFKASRSLKLEIMVGLLREAGGGAS